MSDLISVSTKKGDKGESYLASGKKFSKSDIVFEVLGTLDELNSHLGLVIVKMKTFGKVQKDVEIIPKLFIKNTKFLLEIQNTLFYLGAELAESPKVKLSQHQLSKLERKSNKLQEEMADNWITKFVLPGGTELGAHLDIARTVSRRLERLVVKLSEDKEKKVPKLILRYINRLSDYLFILRCFVNDKLSAKEKLFNTETS